MKRSALLDNFFGAVRGRQREKAIGIQMMNHDACRRSNLSFALLLHDVTNAFYCPLDTAFNDWWENAEPLYAKDLTTKSSTVQSWASGG